MGEEFANFQSSKQGFPSKLVMFFLPILEKCMPFLQKVVLANPFPFRSGGTTPGAEKENEEETKVLSKAKEREGEEGCEVCFPFRFMRRRRRGRKVN